MFKKLYYILAQRLFVFKNKNKPSQGKIYMFHELDNRDDEYAISDSSFLSLIDFLYKNKKIVDIEAMVNNPKEDNIVITFDDAYKSVYEKAYPILRELNVPYYIFICNEYLDRDKYLTKEMVKEMLENSNCIIGSHSLKHEISRLKDNESLRKELSNSKAELEHMFDIKIDSFAFPYGSMYAVSNENIILANELFKYIFMTYSLSYNQEYGNVIPRININQQNYKREMI